MAHHQRIPPNVSTPEFTEGIESNPGSESDSWVQTAFMTKPASRVSKSKGGLMTKLIAVIKSKVKVFFIFSSRNPSSAGPLE